MNSVYKLHCSWAPFIGKVLIEQSIESAITNWKDYLISLIWKPSQHNSWYPFYEESDKIAGALPNRYYSGKGRLDWLLIAHTWYLHYYIVYMISDKTYISYSTLQKAKISIRSRCDHEFCENSAEARNIVVIQNAFRIEQKGRKRISRFLPRIHSLAG